MNQEEKELYTRGSTGQYRLAKKVIPNSKMYVKDTKGEFQLVDWQKKELRSREIATVLSDIEYKTEQARYNAIETFTDSNLSIRDIELIISPLLRKERPNSNSRPGVL